MDDFKYINKYSPHYSERGFSAKLARVAKKAGINVVYYALLLHGILMSGNVSRADKIKIIAVLGYFICPVDLIPDAVPALGYTDDIAALLWTLKTVWVNITPDIEAAAKARLHKWFGDYDESSLKEIITTKK